MSRYIAVRRAGWREWWAPGVEGRDEISFSGEVKLLTFKERWDGDGGSALRRGWTNVKLLTFNGVETIYRFPASKSFGRSEASDVQLEISVSGDEREAFDVQRMAGVDSMEVVSRSVLRGRIGIRGGRRESLSGEGEASDVQLRAEDRARRALRR